MSTDDTATARLAAHAVTRERPGTLEARLRKAASQVLEETRGGAYDRADVTAPQLYSAVASEFSDDGLTWPQQSYQVKWMFKEYAKVLNAWLAHLRATREKGGVLPPPHALLLEAVDEIARLKEEIARVHRMNRMEEDEAQPLGIRDAAQALLQWHLERADIYVHPCDARNDAVRVAQCIPEAQALYAALSYDRATR